MLDEFDPLRFQCDANSRRSEVEVSDDSEPPPSRFRRGMHMVTVVPCPISLPPRAETSDRTMFAAVDAAAPMRALAGAPRKNNARLPPRVLLGRHR
jgi:hypothetical protein